MASSLFRPAPTSTDSSILQLAPVLHLADPHRSVLAIAPAPPCPITGRTVLAALSDALGRVIIFDVDRGQAVRIVKGVRGAQCAWGAIPICAQGSDSKSDSSPARVLILFIYLPNRGILEAHIAGGGRVGAVNVARGGRLVSEHNGILGAGAQGRWTGGVGGVWIVESGGRIRKVEVGLDMSI
ncbi:hypothetical protein M427DRAFT_375909 [Gonapodya prolifera JEL478]|uniref:Rab3-GAP regulatory subunit N-terminal domain-containing protein n=1 Tax=Gonapodya prolifera (strain JEL478) TaxID=1344416 RepID=A0A139AUS5_GONPJ|nr:hypothetical protein M427DRAFT_375909 [Gonapodya prolifera JEL478]|eukprot:KXS20454.1 hypothetical protein M427DRAFT_375909 [Gonapodya prolifera JEL478]